MSGEKTEQPTSKKLREARQKGDVAHSKDFTQTLLVLALFGYMLGNAHGIAEALGRLILIPSTLVALPFERALPLALDAALREGVHLVLPFVLIVLIVGLFAEFLQVGVVLAFEKLKPSGKKLNVMENLKNMFAKKNLVELLKSVIKIAFLTVLVVLVVRDALPALMAVPHSGLAGLEAGVGGMMRTLVVNIAFAYVVISLADFVWQRMQYRKGLMMSKEDIKQEFKEMEGDPHIKHMRKHLHQEMVMHGAVENTRRASVLITNPTHLAIAVFYDPDETPLPVVLAKGEGALAEQMMRAAREAGVPVMQNIPLARSLMAAAQVEQFIPSELIEPVAEVLRLVRKMAANPESQS
ncbi:type III secretion system export apparatus subunit SctU [Achromobacter sp. Bel]|uniref:type III secretion system export apparatus subunit SctU n=1 Tax=Achromobacter sp. Bel TaxID=2727415 RepID=UPI00145EA19F|nr:type III secretion system export apparatus subunit SctU [Achromobacter sp. Bel]NMK50025.1 type III secretion system export apparatus subunit SctU [Achromobacter sp. Bel]